MNSPHEVGEVALSQRSPFSGDSVPWNGVEMIVVVVVIGVGVVVVDVLGVLVVCCVFFVCVC